VKPTTKQLFTRLFILVLSFLCSMGLFTLVYRLDNKYRLQTPQPINGILFYEPEQFPVVYLINGWEYYRQKLLTPEDFQEDAPLPDDYIFIGQYGGMEAGDANASPHGSATYRLLLSLPDTPASYTLELPEIYSSYRLYIDGRLMASQGNPDRDQYRPALRAGSLTFEGSGDMELLLAVSDWSHLYGGLVYPPAFGTPSAVTSLLDQRFAISLSATALALLLGIFQLALAITLRNRHSLLSGLICLAFAGSVCSPALHRLTTTAIVPFYNLEIFCRYAVYGLPLLLVPDLCGRKSRYITAASCLAALFPFAALAVSLAAPSLSYRDMALFSRIAGIYKAVCALYLLGMAFWAKYHSESGDRESESDSDILLIAVTIFASSLAADRLYPGFEPSRLGWFSEIAGFLFVLILSFLLLRDSARLYQKQLILTQQKRHMEEQIAMQKKHYTELASQIETIRVMRHDIRHHLTQLSALLKDGNAESAAQYLDKLTGSALTASPLTFCSAYHVDVLLRYYYSKAEEQQIPMTIHASLPEQPGIPEEDLCVILGNLLENALEATIPVPAPDRRISVSMASTDGSIAIEIKNTYTGKRVPNGETFHSSKDMDKDTVPHGIGLSSVRSVVEKYSGDLWFHTEEGTDNPHWFTVQVLMITEDKTDRLGTCV